MESCAPRMNWVHCRLNELLQEKPHCWFKVFFLWLAFVAWYRLWLLLLLLLFLLSNHGCIMVKFSFRFQTVAPTVLTRALRSLEMPIFLWMKWIVLDIWCSPIRSIFKENNNVPIMLISHGILGNCLGFVLNSKGLTLEKWRKLRKCYLEQCIKSCRLNINSIL